MAIGPNLSAAMQLMESATGEEGRQLIASTVGQEATSGLLPVSLRAERVEPQDGESWETYSARVEKALEPLRTDLYQMMDLKTEILRAANGLRVRANPDQVRAINEQKRVEFLDLDAVMQVVSMDEVGDDIELPAFRIRHASATGRGVRVAVLDSGVDSRHPMLAVAHNTSTSPETWEIPGSHGTHCAGSIASQDAIFPGIAPGVTLLNVKVLDSAGRGTATDIVRGIDAALDLGVDVLSMSLGFNHLPAWAANGHGWVCPQGNCVLCRAVDNATNLGNALVVVAAGNEHVTAEALRARGFGSSFDTEYGCPGQAREALTVAALTKRRFDLAEFSSRGPTAYGGPKPDIAADGVNITSTIPVPRDVAGNPTPNAPRSALFGRKSGTSMATPIVAGAAALLIQIGRDAGQAWLPKDIKRMLLGGAVSLGLAPSEAGAGRLSLRTF